MKEVPNLFPCQTITLIIDFCTGVTSAAKRVALLISDEGVTVLVVLEGIGARKWIKEDEEALRLCRLVDRSC